MPRAIVTYLSCTYKINLGLIKSTGCSAKAATWQLKNVSQFRVSDALFWNQAHTWTHEAQTYKQSTQTHKKIKLEKNKIKNKVSMHYQLSVRTNWMVYLRWLECLNFLSFFISVLGLNPRPWVYWARAPPLNCIPSPSAHVTNWARIFLHSADTNIWLIFLYYSVPSSYALSFFLTM